MSDTQQIPLGIQLRNEFKVAERRRDDAAQLATALDIGAQLADRCDSLLEQNRQLEQEVEMLKAAVEVLSGNAPGAPGSDPGGSGAPGGPAEAHTVPPGASSGTPGPDELPPEADDGNGEARGDLEPTD